MSTQSFNFIFRLCARHDLLLYSAQTVRNDIATHQCPAASNHVWWRRYFTLEAGPISPSAHFWFVSSDIWIHLLNMQRVCCLHARTYKGKYEERGKQPLDRKVLLLSVTAWHYCVGANERIIITFKKYSRFNMHLTRDNARYASGFVGWISGLLPSPVTFLCSCRLLSLFVCTNNSQFLGHGF